MFSRYLRSKAEYKPRWEKKHFCESLLDRASVDFSNLSTVVYIETQASL